MPVVAASGPSGGRQPGTAPARRGASLPPAGARLLVFCLPAVFIGLLIRVWVVHTSVMSLNSDEAITGLQGLEVLGGTFRLVVAGNDYGATTESYLVAPLMAFWSGPAPLRFLSLVLSGFAAWALFLLARPFVGRIPAAVTALVGWSMSAAVVMLWSRSYLGYLTGFIAQVAVLGLACHAMRSKERLGRTAFLAGFAAGFAIWSHPMFGAVSLLALIAPTAYRMREWRWWVPATLGGAVGVSPWLLFIAGRGLPTPALATVTTTYSERLQNFVTQLLPRAFGLRTPDGAWVTPSSLAVAGSVVLIAAAVFGWAVLVARCGLPALPVLIAGGLAFPVLALWSQLGFVADARYALPFLPELLLGLAAWTLLLPARVRESPWTVAVIPAAWAVLFCVPVLHQQVGWQYIDAERDAYAVTTTLAEHDIHYLAGDYWGTYLADYLADGALSVRPDQSIRLTDEAERVAGSDPALVAYVYTNGASPQLPLPVQRYQRLVVGAYDLYLPRSAG